ncbi:MAG: hypothetical protein L3J52_10420 [Proteobacteria bacterium]|nr:hypothetical protein [Pseudomonadota bacterium]
MKQTTITFIINAKVYKLMADDALAISKIPSSDRHQLIRLLESIEKHDQRLKRESGSEPYNITTLSQVSEKQAKKAVVNTQNKAVRLGKGDVNDLMANLIMQEKRKPPLNKWTIYKWFGIFAFIVFLLVLIF